MVEALAELETGGLHCAPQAEAGVTYASKIGKDEGRVDWREPAAAIHNRVRGLSPFPGAWFEMQRGKGTERVKLLRTKRVEGETGAPGAILSLDPLVVACGEGAIKVLEVQRAGKRPVAAAEFLRGARLAAGTVLG